MEYLPKKKKKKELRDFLKKAPFLSLPETSFFSVIILWYKKTVYLIHIKTLKYSQIQEEACFKYRQIILSEA